MNPFSLCFKPPLSEEMKNGRISISYQLFKKENERKIFYVGKKG